MRVIAEEIEGINRLTDNYLQTYEDVIAGYKQYKRDKACLHVKAEEVMTHGK